MVLLLHFTPHTLRGSIEGPNAVNAYAKAALVYIAIQQQLVLLGAT